MMKQTYIGNEERVFPVLGVTVKNGDEVETPEGFTHPDFSTTGKTNTKSVTEPPVVTGLKVGE